MQPFILLITLVVVTSAKQLSSGPVVSKESQSVSSSSQNIEKRYATQEIVLYLSPSEIRSLQGRKNYDGKQLIQNQNQESQLSFESNDEDQQQNAWSQYFKSLGIEKSQGQFGEAFNSQSKPIFENQNEFEQEVNNEFQNYQKNNIIKSQQERERQELALKKEEQSLLQEQLQQHWNRILDHNRAQLKSFSGLRGEKQRTELSKVNESPQAPRQSDVRNEDDQKSEIEKEIEYLLSGQSEYNFKDIGLSERLNQRQPIVIQKEIRVTKHHPVPVVQKVNVPVPRPILVPVPEPVEVKVPHPYPVPYEVVKHIPIPILRNH